MNTKQKSSTPIAPVTMIASSRFLRVVASLSVGLLAVLLLIVGGNAASATAQLPQQLDVSLRGEGLPAVEPSGTPYHGGDDDEEELYGQLVYTVTAFIGEWVISVDESREITVLLTAQTNVRKFNNRLPVPGDWLEVEGVFLPDGRLDAQKVRPDDFVSNQVIVRLKPTDDPAAVAATLAERHDMTVSAVLPSANIFLFTTTDDEESEAGRLLGSPLVEWAEINWVSRTPTGDPYRTWKWGSADDGDYINQTAFAQVNLSPAQEQVTGAGVIVATLDTGIDLQHPAFDGDLLLLQNSDLISDTDTPDDIGPGLAWGHGTHIAGVIHAIAPNARLMPLRILDSQGRGNTFVLAYAIEVAVANGADVINLSLGADCDSKVLGNTIESAIAQGVVIVAAAGNDSVSTPQCPAAMPGVLSVAAVDENRQRADWSNYGDWISLAAPGIGITSTFPLGYGVETDTSGYASWSGTSMATPFAAGAAALLVEMRAAVAGSQPVAEMLTSHGDDISLLNPEPFHVGRHLNIAAAVDGYAPEQEPIPTPTPTAPAFTVFLPTMIR